MDMHLGQLTHLICIELDQVLFQFSNTLVNYNYHDGNIIF